MMVNWDEVRDTAMSEKDRAAYDKAQRELAEATEQPCSEGNCIEWISPSGVYLGGWGPVGCPCQR